MDRERQTLRKAAKYIKSHRSLVIDGYIRSQQTLLKHMIIPTTIHKSILIFRYFGDVFQSMKLEYIKMRGDDQFKLLKEITRLVAITTFDAQLILYYYDEYFVSSLINRLKTEQIVANPNIKYIAILTNALKAIQTKEPSKSILSPCGRPQAILIRTLYLYADNKEIKNAIFYLLARMISYDRYTKYYFYRFYINHSHNTVNVYDFLLKQIKNMQSKIDGYSIENLENISHIAHELCTFNHHTRNDNLSLVLNIIVEVIILLSKMSSNDTRYNDIVFNITSLIMTITSAGSISKISHEIIHFLKNKDVLSLYLCMAIKSSSSNRLEFVRFMHNIICCYRIENVTNLLDAGLVYQLMDVMSANELELDGAISKWEYTKILFDWMLLLKSSIRDHGILICDNSVAISIIMQKIQSKSFQITNYALGCVEAILKNPLLSPNTLIKHKHGEIIDIICKKVPMVNYLNKCKILSIFMLLIKQTMKQSDINLIITDKFKQNDVFSILSNLEIVMNDDEADDEIMINLQLIQHYQLDFSCTKYIIHIIKTIS